MVEEQLFLMYCVLNRFDLGKDAGLVREERRGRWAFYSLDREAAGHLLAEAAVYLDGHQSKVG
jgi:hypothetical protein